MIRRFFNSRAARFALLVCLIAFTASSLWLATRPTPAKVPAQPVPSAQADQGGPSAHIPSAHSANATSREWPRWGGAISSAAFDGAGFFDRRIAREFLTSHPKEARNYIVELVSRSLLPIGGEAALDEVLPDAGEQSRVAFIQFHENPSPEERKALQEEGVELLNYFNAYAWSARGTREAFTRALKRASVRALARLDARDKLSAEVFFGKVPAHATTAGGAARLRFLSQPGMADNAFAAMLNENAALKGHRVAIFEPDLASVLGARAQTSAPLELAAALANFDSVAYVSFIPPPAAPRDATTDLISNINDVRDAPVAPLNAGLSGEGITVAIRELGKMDLHIDYTDNNRFGRVDDVPVNSSDNLHATAVTGVVGGSGINFSNAKGVAPRVRLLGFVAGENRGGSDLFSKQDIVNAASMNARISNHSYGPVMNGSQTDNTTDSFGTYDSISADWDAALRSSNLVAVFSANEESGNKSGHIDFFVGMKNGICVGATNNAARAADDNPSTPATNGIAYYSEFGPMDDGRVKPDLVAYGGNNLATPDGNVVVLAGTNATSEISGTSFAAPAVSGIAALVLQHYKAVVGSEPSAALAKALLCNSATDLGLPGPDAAYGFGVANAEAAAATIRTYESAAVTPFQEDDIVQGEEKSYTVSVSSSAQLKLTLCWMDAPGVPSSAKALVNDLDVELVDPAGSTTYFPFSLAPVASSSTPPQAATASGKNAVDPIEQIIVNSPVNGNWTVRVRGASVPLGPQRFALVLNQASQPPALSATITASPTSGEAPLAVTFIASGTGNNVVYSWFFPDDQSTQTGRVVEHIFRQTGEWTVKLNVTRGTEKLTPEPTITISVRNREIQSFAAKAKMRLNFAAGSRGDDLQLSMIANDPIHITGDAAASKGFIWPRTTQQAREAIRDGEFEGKRYTIAVTNPLTGNSVTEAVLLDRRASYKSDTADVRLNLRNGEVLVRLKRAGLGAALGLETTTPKEGKAINLNLKFEGERAVYSTTFSVQYFANGKSGTGKTR
ncbi:MAG TPA: S8 family serine peptidase [Planctomycetota bacterium]|nr:S8 family serine peptidase [Planctomycetota bacterium]